MPRRSNERDSTAAAEWCPRRDDATRTCEADTKALRFRLSTAQTLSFVAAGVVVAVLATAMAVVWLTLARSEVREAQEFVDRSVRQLVSVTLTGLRSAQIRYTAVARDTNVLAALRSPDATRAFFASAALERLATPGDSGMPIELWTAAGGRVAFVGHDLSEPIALRAGSEEGRPQPVVHPGLDSLKAIDSVQTGSVYRVGNRAYYWMVMPILVDGTMAGFISQQRRIAENPQGEQTLRELSGNSATGYYHNVDGSEWTTFGGEAADPPGMKGPKQADWTRADVGRLLHAERRLGNTQLVLAMEIPRGAAVARATDLVKPLTLVSVLLTLIAALAAWLAGRRVASPLTRLTSAAESVARGDFTARVPADGSEEIVRLASSFNWMAGQIGESLSMLEARETDLRTLANAIPQLAWMADAQGDVFWLNERWQDFTGSVHKADGEAAPATLWANAHDPAALPQVLRRWRASVVSGEPFEMEVLLRARSGESRWFLTRVAPVCDRDGHVTRWFGTSTDIQTLWDARKAAEAGNRAKSDFLAAMSHELRTPLNAIGGYAELLEMGIRGPISDEQRHDLRRIRASQSHLLGLIGSLLDLTRIESGRVTYETVRIEIDPFLATIEGLVLPQVAAKRQTLTRHVADDDLAVLADEEKLRQILLNLLSNAVRHCPTGAAIRVTAGARDGPVAAIMVHDTGPGIPPDRHESIFEPFVQLGRSLTNPTEGIGLGLAISRDLARGMGGDLTVASIVGKGSCFTVTLPTRMSSVVPTAPLSPGVERAAVKMH